MSISGYSMKHPDFHPEPKKETYPQDRKCQTCKNIFKIYCGDEWCNWDCRSCVLKERVEEKRREKEKRERYAYKKIHGKYPEDVKHNPITNYFKTKPRRGKSIKDKK